MDRSSFLRSLFVLVASPKVLAEIRTKPKPVIGTGVLNDLQFVIPDYIPKLYEKYDPNASYVDLQWDKGKHGEYITQMVYHFEKQSNARDIS